MAGCLLCIIPHTSLSAKIITVDVVKTNHPLFSFFWDKRNQSYLLREEVSIVLWYLINFDLNPDNFPYVHFRGKQAK